MGAPSSHAAHGSVELRGGNARVVILPALGGKIAELWFGERQWLWRNEQLPFRAPQKGASYVLTADSGGLDECFPTVTPCALPSLVRGAGGRELPDHGELWAQPAAMQLRTDADGHRAVLTWDGECLPYRFERSLLVTPHGEVRCDYAVTNLGEQKIPFLWAAHALLPLGPETRVVLPEGARMRVSAEHGIDLGGAGAEHRWPRARSGGQLLDFSAPGLAWKKPFACMLHVDLARSVRSVSVREGRERLTAAFGDGDVTHLGLWVNHGGWNPLPRTSWLPWRKPAPYRNLGFEPGIGAPGALSDALGSWDGASWIEPRATRRWTVTWTGGATEETE